ncbi:Hypothetical predicted protein [Drosophila guanche]|uniref:Uncharacterized protein n=1 Tax=Drosophila guanche TaxID=7266 RepID=A0A3B0JWL3_DROGU|nr:Hypothetical predicted protein [Drosophila guanche]
MDLAKLMNFAYRILYITVTLAAVIASPRITINLRVSSLKQNINFDYPELMQTVMVSTALSLLAAVPLEFNAKPLVRRHLKMWFIMPLVWSAVCCLMFLQNLLLMFMALYNTWDIQPEGWLTLRMLLYVCFFIFALELMFHWKVVYDLKMDTEIESHINDDYRRFSPVV